MSILLTRCLSRKPATTRQPRRARADKPPLPKPPLRYYSRVQAGCATPNLAPQTHPLRGGGCLRARPHWLGIFYVNYSLVSLPARRRPVGAGFGPLSWLRVRPLPLRPDISCSWTCILVLSSDVTTAPSLELRIHRIKIHLAQSFEPPTHPTQPKTAQKAVAQNSANRSCPSPTSAPESIVRSPAGNTLKVSPPKNASPGGPTPPRPRGPPTKLGRANTHTTQSPHRAGGCGPLGPPPENQSFQFSPFCPNRLGQTGDMTTHVPSHLREQSKSVLVYLVRYCDSSLH